MGNNDRVLQKINELRNQHFEGWSDDSKNGYLTALKTVEWLLGNHLHSPTEPESYPGHKYQGLFNLMSEQYRLTLLEDEMNQIINEVRKMDSNACVHEPEKWGTNELPSTQQPDTLYEGDYVQNLSESEFYTLIDLENDSYRLDWIEGIGLVKYNGVLVTDDYPPAPLKNQLTPEEFLCRAENTFKTK